MSQAFTFPPPPPPPPPKPAAQPAQSLATRAGQWGRGGNQYSFQASPSRGHYPPRRGQRGGHGHASRGNAWNSARGGYFPNFNSLASDVSNGRGRHTESPTHAGQKRDHSAAFNARFDQSTKNHRPKAPPAVPKFGLDLDKLLQKRPESVENLPVPLPRKTNILGLTPMANGSDSEDEGDEEAKLAGAAIDNLLQFEYNGRTSTLSTPDEIAAWIAERRKKWPTGEKREIARKAAEQKKKKWEAEKAARLEASRASAKARQEQLQKQKLERERSLVRQRVLKEHIQKSRIQPVQASEQTAAQRKAEKLRRKAEKIAEQLKAAEAALDANGPGENVELDALLAEVDTAAAAQGVEVDDTDASDCASDNSSETELAADDTSTSGSSSDAEDGSESDSAPEESTSKRAAPDRVHPPPRKAPQGSSTDQRPLCKAFSATGRCRFGRRCHYKHEKAARPFESTAGSRRKGLFQVMVEKEQEEEKRRALQAIIALGDAGVLDAAA